MLAGLGGAVVPLLIHLLGRARYRTVEWGAMMFIEPATPRQRDPGRLREYLLLAVRMAAVALLAIALARPVSGMIGAATGETRVVAAIVVDCSASMAYEDVGGARIEQARAAALQILSTLRRGDRVALIAAGAGFAAQSPQLSGDLQSVAAHVAELTPAAGAADLPAAIESAAGVLGRQDRVSRQLYVISDRQAGNWTNVDDAFIASWRAHAPLARFAVIPVGGRETDNVAIESVSLINPPAIAGCPAEVQIRIHNYSTELRTGMPLVVRLNGRETLNTTVNLPPAETTNVTAPVTFGPAGSQVLTASIRAPGADLDDDRDALVDVSPPIRVLLVRGDAGGHWLRAALAPFSATKTQGADLALMDEVTVDDWDAAGLSAYRAVVLDNVPAPTPEQVAALEQFVYAGGGLLLAPGPSSRTNLYNQLLYREDNGLLPALLQPAMAQSPPQTIERASIDTSHPMMHFLRNNNGELSASIDRYFATTGRTAASHVLASFASGDPFVMETPFGRGRVVLVTCSLDPEWSTFPLTTLYLPLLQSTARFLAGATTIERNALMGDELIATFEPAINSVRTLVIRPDGTRDTAEVNTIDDRSEARYARTDIAGLYTVRAGARGERSETFCIAPPAEESDLASLDESRWQELSGALGFTRMEPSATPLAARLVGRRGGEEHWLAALSGVLVLLVLELGLTRLWSAREGAA